MRWKTKYLDSPEYLGDGKWKVDSRSLDMKREEGGTFHDKKTDTEHYFGYWKGISKDTEKIDLREYGTCLLGFANKREEDVSKMLKISLGTPLDDQKIPKKLIQEAMEKGHLLQIIKDKYGTTIQSLKDKKWNPRIAGIVNRAREDYADNHITSLAFTSFLERMSKI